MNRMSKAICMIMTVVVLLSLASLTCFASDNSSVTGTLTLPNGMKAPNGGLNVKLTLYRIENSDTYFFAKVMDVTIPEGSSSTEYSFNFEDKSTEGNTGSPYTVGYEILDLKGLPIIAKANYLQYEHPDTPNGEKFMLTNGKKEHVNVGIYASKFIKVTVSLPNGIKAAIPKGFDNIDAISFNIIVYGAKSGSLITEQKVDIPIGQNSVELSLGIPSDIKENQVIIKYDNGDYSYSEEGHIHFAEGYKPWISGILPYGYYCKQRTTEFKSDATPIDTSNNGKIAFVLLSGKTISGEIIDPTVNSSTNTIETTISVEAEEVNNSSHVFNTAIHFKGNMSSYSIEVPQSNKKYYISYNIFSYGGNGPVARYGYFSNSGSVTDVENATSVEVDTDVRNINMKLSVMRTIAGKVSLPKGMKTPPKGFSIDIGAVPDYLTKDPGVVSHNEYYMRSGAISYSGSKTITMKSGESSAAYSLYVPANSKKWGYKLRYLIYNTNGLAVEKTGYMSSAGMSGDITYGSFLDVSNADKKDADLIVLKKGVGSKVSAGGKKKQDGQESIVTGYDKSIHVSRDWGNSTITIDNSKSSSSIYAKLYYIGDNMKEVARAFTVKKGDKFVLENLSAGSYELHCRDLATAKLYKTDTLVLDETDKKSTDMTVILYGVTNGNLKTYPIDSRSF